MLLFVTLHTGYCGSDAHALWDVSNKHLGSELLDTLIWEAAIENASNYGYELCSEDCEDDDCQLEHPGSTNISGHYVRYDPTEHRGHLYNEIPEVIL